MSTPYIAGTDDIPEDSPLAVDDQRHVAEINRRNEAAQELQAGTLIPSEFRDRLEELINLTSAENGSDTPDWLLASYLSECLATFDKHVLARDAWYGAVLTPGRARIGLDPALSGGDTDG